MNKVTNAIMQQNLQRVFNKICQKHSEHLPDESTIKSMIQRNWDFDFYISREILEYSEWLESSDEHSNYTYSLRNINQLLGWISCVTGASMDAVEAVVDEIVNDEWLTNYIISGESSVGKINSVNSIKKNAGKIYGRRIGWYAVARIKRPRLIVETGVDRGLGSVVLCRALQRNHSEGFPGRYLGTDINPNAGYLLERPLLDFGQIVYGDSLQTLRRLNQYIDLFVNDSDHSADYEALEYEAIKDLLGQEKWLGEFEQVG